MIFINHDSDNAQRPVILKDFYKGVTAILMGGAPTIKTQPLHLLEQRGLLVAAMNNTAKHFRPTLWFSSDHPESFEPRILKDPGIMKFAPLGFAAAPVFGKAYSQVPNTFFYLQEKEVPIGTLLHWHQSTPWHGNTLLVAIAVLYDLGCRRIILGGSDFEFSGGNVYAHATDLSKRERELNVMLYSTQVLELKRLKPAFVEAGLTLLDCSVKSKLADTYDVLSMEDAVALCLKDFPAADIDSNLLPHGTRFADPAMKKKLRLDRDVPAQQPEPALTVIL